MKGIRIADSKETDITNSLDALLRLDNNHHMMDFKPTDFIG
jgi:hypothetical protein